MSNLSLSHLITAIVFFLLGLFICQLLKFAETNTVYVGQRKKYNRRGFVLYIVIFVIFILFVMLQKPSYGLLPYLEVFRAMKTYDVDLFSLNGLYTNEMEPLFLLWCYIIKFFTNSESAFIFITFSYIWIAVLWFIASYTQKTRYTVPFMMMWPVLIDFIFGMRYALAVGHCLIALVTLRKRKYIIAGIFVLIASFTHFLAFAFFLFIGFYYFVRIFFRRINSVKTLVILALGVMVFSNVAFAIYQTFRVSYRISEEVETNSILSYAPYVLLAVVILYFNRKKNEDHGDNLCALAVYFNMLMIPITISWGIYRLPYLLLLPIVIEISNTFGDRKAYKSILRPIVTFIILVFSFVKIVTTGVQNMSLDYTFNF